MRLVAVLVMFVLAVAAVHAQVTTATFYGVVHDPAGAIIPDAAVSMTNEGTGIRISRQTDSGGEFAFSFLPVGSYTLRIEKAGFATYQQKAIELQSGQVARPNFTMTVGTLSEQVTVVAELPLLKTTSSEQSENTATFKIRELPLAERSLLALGGLTTGVVALGRGGNNAGMFNFSGLGGASASITVDGTDASANPQANQMLMFGGFNYIPVISLEAVDELQVTKGIMPAEYAPSMSGNFNIVTKSGTNQWHGSLFENYQGRALNARNQFLSSKAPFTFNQFGGSAGGHIWTNKLFVFGAYEGYRRAVFQVVQGNAPTQLLRDEMLAAVPVYSLYLDHVPNANQPTPPGALLGLFFAAKSQRGSDNHLVVKPDYWITDHHKLSVTYTRGRPSQTSANVVDVDPRIFSAEADRITGTYTTFTSRWVAESRFGYNRNYVNRLDAWYNIKDPNKKETIEAGRRVPTIKMFDIELGGGEANVTGEPGNWSLEQKASVQIGKHALKFGGLFFDRRLGGLDLESPIVQYLTLDEVLANRPSLVQVTFGLGSYAASAKDFGLFVQDDWRLTPRLVLNLGLRYDYFGKFVAHGKHGGGPYLYNPDGLLDDSFHLGPFRPVDDPFHSDGLNLGPRAGFAYNPDGRGTNVFRLGVGALFTPVPVGDFFRGIITSPTFPYRSWFTQQQAVALGLRFPVYNEDAMALVQESGLGRSIAVINPSLQAPYSLNLYAGYERALRPSLMLETAFVGNHGVKLVMRRAYNEADRVTNILPNPDIGKGYYFDNTESTHYFSWQTSLRKRYSNSLAFDVHYTWAKTLAYGSGEMADAPQNQQGFFEVHANKGPAINDLTHIVTGDFVYYLPELTKLGNRLVRHVAGGWELSGILSARTGPPINVTQPSSVGDSSRPDATGIPPILSDYRSTLVYLNPAAFQLVPVSDVSDATIRPGNLGNGAIRAPGMWQLDLGLAKNFSVTERIHFQFRADLFNALNHTNLTNVSTSLQAVNFGRLTSTTGARAIQLNARLRF